MKWRSEYAIGNTNIDEQHKMLFSVIKNFGEVLENGYGSKTYDLFLDFLNRYSKIHFDFEEECMLAHQCPVVSKNKREFKRFTKAVEQEVKNYQQRGFDNERAWELLDWIDNWFENHICRVDCQLKHDVG